jgi:hypothetical protein
MSAIGSYLPPDCVEEEELELVFPPHTTMTLPAQMAL